jgi:hypothetical protein
MWGLQLFQNTGFCKQPLTSELVHGARPLQNVVALRGNRNVRAAEVTPRYREQFDVHRFLLGKTLFV